MSHDVTAESEEELHAAEHWLSAGVAIILVLNVVSLAIGQWLHTRHLYWLPECGATILVGVCAGIAGSLLLPPDVEAEEAHMYFDPTFFTLVLLPPIIFEAGYALDLQLFRRNAGKILTLAVLGTLISTAVTWAALYAFFGTPGGASDSSEWIVRLSFSESGQFAALISAVDPVATLAVFGALRVDPMLQNLVVGESVLNDAVALIAFRAITHYGLAVPSEAASIAVSFVLTGLGSALMGTLFGLGASATLRLLGMGRRADLAHVEGAVFACFAYGSYVCSELPENSGIVAAMFAGMAMRAFARPNLSARARIYVDVLLQLLTTLCDNTIYLLVGFALTLELPFVLRPDLPGNHLHLGQSAVAFAVTMLTCLAARALHLFPILALFNQCTADASQRVSTAQMVVMWHAGLRGAIAVALAYQVVGPNAHMVRAATMLMVVGTTFLFGGSTKWLLDRLHIPTGWGTGDDEPPPDAAPAAGVLPPRSSVLSCLERWLVDQREDAFDELVYESSSKLLLEGAALQQQEGRSGPYDA